MKRCVQCGEQYDDNTRFCTRDGKNLEPVSEHTPASFAETVVRGKEPQTDPMIGRVIAGRYRLLEKIGQGGMGAVYKGQHTRINRLTAIKLLTSELVSNEEFIARFQREAEMASQIDHPNAVAIYDFGEAEDGLIYLAMEFVNGQPLSSIIRKGGPLSLDRAVRIAKQAADALGAAHNLGIIHRDFKPDNIMVCDKPERPDWVEVVDFGIAKRAVADSQQAGLTQAGFVLGTPLYMSPEQVAGEDLDPRSDLYSLALVVYEMLTGALPFDGGTTQSQMVKRLLEPPKPLKLARPHLALPPAVESVIMRALSRKPEDRHASTKEFAEELERAARSEPITQPQRGVTNPQQGRTKQSDDTPVETRPRHHSNPNTPAQPSVAPPNPGPSVPRYNTPYPARPTPMPYTPQYPQPAQPSYPYYPQYVPPPKSNKTRNTILIVVAVILSLMGGCVMLAIIGMNAKKGQPNSGYPANANLIQRSASQSLSPGSNASQSSGRSNYNAVPISSDAFLAAAIKQVNATYPPLAKSAHVSGSVIVEMTVDEEGNVISTTVTSGDALLRDAALSAARQWKFNPIKIGGVPKKVVSSLSFNFND
jgi:TonB family protein